VVGAGAGAGAGGGGAAEGAGAGWLPLYGLPLYTPPGTVQFPDEQELQPP